ncbi:TetR/AcrR family transcriptional regulator [Alkalibacillus salilacus]|uniref:AcrR family transcriptional regulator n=1 Tax=Alkalibacillus salilacus TaxID=284582 RepID=A0ABT9VHL0_9BACI|nr:TetR/AcrR family transcriptional regulator [Alkalibacillus salilacus]MDQ0160446.1 AcrR family transcriptional regulator [Alkalibacillus salilacus]
MSTTKEQIKVAATSLFAEEGFRGMTIKQIAKEVGIKPPSVYAFFEGKEDLFLTIYHDLLDGHRTTVKSQLNQDISSKQQLFNILKSVIEFQNQERLKSKFLIQLMISPPAFLEEDIKARFKQMEDDEYEVLQEIFQRAIDSQEIDEHDSTELAIVFQGMMDGLFWQMQRYDVEIMTQRMDLLFQQFWKSLNLNR